MTITWTDHLDAFENAITRAEAALNSGDWLSDGWTLPSLAVPGDAPTAAHRARYRQLSERVSDIVPTVQGLMGSIQHELSDGGKRREAAHAYGQQRRAGEGLAVRRGEDLHAAVEFES